MFRGRRLPKLPAHAGPGALPERIWWVQLICAAALGLVVLATVNAGDSRPAGAVQIISAPNGVVTEPATVGPGLAVGSVQIVPFSSMAGFSTHAAPVATTSPVANTGPIAVGLAADGIPSIALAAYQRAAAEADASYPGCGIIWPLLAGIGRVESNHGRFGGAQTYATGLTSPRIIGIALNGHGTALIRDTDHGRFDGDAVYDHAVGPMQFIPSTWAHWGVDGNRDGVADPFNLFDAARAAADYLCFAGGNLTTSQGQINAVMAYNHSSAYLHLVISLEKVYAAGHYTVTVTLPPSGTTPTPTPTTSLPPVNPGPPPSSSPPISPTPTRTATPSSAPTPSTTPTPVGCPTPTSTPSPSPSDSPTPSDSPNNSPTPTTSESPTPSDSPSAPAPTGCPTTSAPAASPSVSPSDSSSQTPSAGVSPAPSDTPSGP
jgi:hypothetical protein